MFQRSPGWVFRNAKYHMAVDDRKKFLLKHVPYYANWYRFRMFWEFGDGIHAAFIKDPAWPDLDRSWNKLSAAVRVVAETVLREEVGDDPELYEKMLPSYPVFGKRMLLDNHWFETLRKDHVTLVTDAISAVEPDGVRCADGSKYAADAVILATGFESNKFLWPMKIVGKSGRALNDVWGDEPRAHLGITVPDFPNFFCLFGPNTALAHGGSITFHSECQVRYVMGCLREMADKGHSSLECTRAAHDEYNVRLDAVLKDTVWAHPKVNNWYKNAETGHVVNASPWKLVDYWHMTKAPDLADFIVS